MLRNCHICCPLWVRRRVRPMAKQHPAPQRQLLKDCPNTPQVRQRIRYLEKLQDQHDELEEQFEEEMREIEKKYRAKYGASPCRPASSVLWHL